MAVGLAVAFYGLAILLGVGLIGTPFLVAAAGGPFNIWIAIAMVAAGIAVLRALVPVRNRFSPNGPEITEQTQPELYGLVAAVARDCNEPVPPHIHFDLALNASVTEVSDGPLRPKRRLLQLGLPLVAMLDRDQLRAVIAHEFGHYMGDDLRFAGWIWRTRAANFKAIEILDNQDSWFQLEIVRRPFVAYANLFSRLTNDVSRRQEFAADAISARVAGVDAASSTLRAVAAGSMAFDSYWASDAGFALDRGYRPPITAGFRQFLATVHAKAPLDELVAMDIEKTEPNPHASHPTLAERLTALGAELKPDVQLHDDAATALSAVRDVAGVEQGCLQMTFGDGASQLTEMSWEQAGWLHAREAEAYASQLGSDLNGRRIGEAGELVADGEPGREAMRRVVGQAPPEYLDSAWLAAINSLVCGALERAGWTINALPGRPVDASRNGHSLTVGPELVKVARGEEPASAWSERARALGIADEPLIVSSVPPPA
jgi:Zn-dependent protease with chaperone function